MVTMEARRLLPPAERPMLDWIMARFGEARSPYESDYPAESWTSACEALDELLIRLLSKRGDPCPRCFGLGSVPSGKELRKMRERVQLSQADMAREKGVNQSDLSMVESGRKVPSPTVLAAYFSLREEEACQWATQ